MRERARIHEDEVDVLVRSALPADQTEVSHLALGLLGVDVDPGTAAVALKLDLDHGIGSSPRAAA